MNSSLNHFDVSLIVGGGVGLGGWGEGDMDLTCMQWVTRSEVFAKGQS